MKFLVISDSHGLTKELSDVLNRHQNDVDFIVHCGDSELATDAIELNGVDTVKGNCDVGDFPLELVKDIGDETLYITHGHLYNVKMSSVALSYRSEEVKASIVCFGHSHVATTFIENGIIYINPGSLRLPRGRKEQTYVIVEKKETFVRVFFYDRNGEKVEKLSYVYKRKDTN